MARYLQNQNIVYPTLVCAVIGNIFNIVSQYVTIHVLGFSYLASAICQALSLFIMMVSQIIYILVSKVYVNTWGGFSSDYAFRGWGMFFKLAIPGLFMVGLSEWSYEIATFVAGTIDTVQLGIQTVVFQLQLLLYMLPVGASIAINIRVGQHLGGYRAEHAKTTYHVGLAFILVTATVLATLMWTLRDYMPYVFTNDEFIAEGVSSVLILTAGFQFGDGIMAISCGALRGCGRQLTGAIIIFIGYYMFCLPIGIPLAIATDLKVIGMWIGLIVGMSLVAFISTFVVSRTDWDYQCKLAVRVARGGVSNQSFGGVLEDVKKSDNASGTSEADPLLTKTKRRRGVGKSISFSRRGVLSTSDIHVHNLTEIPDETESIQRILLKRLVFAVFILLWVTAAIVLRALQVTPCYPMNNSTMADYAGILPLCNETSV